MQLTRELKTCLWCGGHFVQPKPPKADQTYCMYGCYVAATRAAEA